jgi:phosphoribosylformylglycinamidine cyclo-ligase
LVAMSVNDVLVQGAEPIMFLDYVATGKADPETLEAVVKGVSEGCLQAGCALLGGETAELPGFYKEGEYDLAGFCVGVVERKRLITGEGVRPGDILLGLPSSGLHSNGYSLARRALLDRGGYALSSTPPELGCSLADELLRPTRIYAQPILKALASYTRKRPITAMAHVTGGGLEGNLSRVLPENCEAVIRPGTWPVPPIFDLVAEAGGVDPEEMRRVFNMGIGLVMVVKEASVRAMQKRLLGQDQPCFVIGEIARGKGIVRYAKR